MRTQQIFNPADFHFNWTENWYEWDRTAAHREALKARNARARELRRQGRKVDTFVLAGQTLTLGGINSGHPEIDLCVNAYGLNAY